MSSPPAARPERTVLVGVTGGIAIYKAVELVRGLVKDGLRAAGRDHGGGAALRHAAHLRGRLAGAGARRRERLAGERRLVPAHRGGPAGARDGGRPGDRQHARQDGRRHGRQPAHRHLPRLPRPGHRRAHHELGDERAPGDRGEPARARRSAASRCCPRKRASWPAARRAPAAWPRPDAIRLAVRRAFAGTAPARSAGKKVVVTSGGTRERIDAVRFIGNRSSGKMGRAVADEGVPARRPGRSRHDAAGGGRAVSRRPGRERRRHGCGRARRGQRRRRARDGRRGGRLPRRAKPRTARSSAPTATRSPWSSCAPWTSLPRRRKPRAVPRRLRRRGRPSARRGRGPRRPPRAWTCSSSTTSSPRAWGSAPTRTRSPSSPGPARRTCRAPARPPAPSAIVDEIEAGLGACVSAVTREQVLARSSTACGQREPAPSHAGHGGHHARRWPRGSARTRSSGASPAWRTTWTTEETEGDFDSATATRRRAALRAARGAGGGRARRRGAQPATPASSPRVTHRHRPASPPTS